jgi:formylglycine-generating enzyme required for sulfatase activity
MRVAIMLSLVPLLLAANGAARPFEASPSRVVGSFEKQPFFRDCTDCPEMVIVPAGTFMMGSPADQPGRNALEGPQRPVTIRSFAVGRYHVTRGELARFAAATKRPVQKGCVWSGGAYGDAKAEAEASWRDLHFTQDDNHPVVCVTWQDAQDFALWLSRRTGKRYRLLSEAEWEYAARAGASTPYP